MFKDLIYKVEENVACITLNRPDAMNAMNHRILQEMIEALEECARDGNVRAVVITGAGRMFSAGGDVKWMQSAQGDDWEEQFDSLVQLLNKVILGIRSLPKPVIAAVNGFASGAGFSLALACDLRMASDKAKFNQAYVNIGLTPDGGSTYFLTRMLGLARATELIFSARVIDAGEAQTLGIVNKVVSGELLEEEAKGMARGYASGPTLAFAKAKALLNMAMVNELDTQLDMEKNSIVSASLTADFNEGLRAFFEKRKPRYTGN